MTRRITKIVRCHLYGETIAEYSLSYAMMQDGVVFAPSHETLINEAKLNLSSGGVVQPPFEDVEFFILDA